MNPFGTTVFGAYTEGIRAILNADLGMFVGEGAGLVRLASVVAIALFGWRVMRDGLGALKLLPELLVLLSFCVFMVDYWTRPVPGIGYSFTGIWTTQIEQWCRQIGWNSVNLIVARSSALWGGAETPSWTNVLGMFNYLVLGLFFYTLQTIAITAVLVPLIMEGILKLIGPVFIFWLLIPHCAFLFWGWLKSFLGFTLAQLVAAAALRLAANILVPAMNQLPDRMSLQFQAGATGSIVALFFALLYVFFKLPTWASYLVSGSSGGGVTDNWWRW
jgi:hypothetical protein